MHINFYEVTGILILNYSIVNNNQTETL